MIYAISTGYSVRPFDEADLEGPYLGWFEDQDVTRYSAHGKLARGLDYYRDYIRTLDRNTNVIWAIIHEHDGHVGNIGLHAISALNRNAEFAIMIGNKAHWTNGVGRAAARALIEHGFEKLNLERIYCGTAATNLAMVRLALALGMTEEGRRRSQLWLDGAWVDVVEYGLLRCEWREAPASA